MAERKGEQPGASMENLPYLEQGTARDRDAKERMTEGKNQYSPAANFPQGSLGRSRDQAGKAIGVSGK